MDRIKKILLVEDEVIIAMAAMESLERLGYSVTHAANGEDAVKQVENDQEISLVLMDLNLGAGMDGVETAAAILNHHDLPVVFLTSYTEQAVVERTEQIVSYGYVLKNSGRAVLDASIKMAWQLFRAHQREKQKDMQYQHLVEMAPDTVIIHKDNIIKFVNKAALELLGAKGPGDLIGRSIFDFLLPEEIEPVQEKISTLKASTEVSPVYTHRLRRLDGGTRIAEVVGKPCDYNGGQAIQVVAHDITEYMNEKMRMVSNEKQLNVAQRIGNMGSWIFHLNSGKITVSQTAYDIYGMIGDKEYTIKDVQKIPLPEYRETLNNALNNLVNRNEKYDVQFEVKRPNDGKIAYIHSVAEYNETDNSVIGIIHDITDSKEKERALVESEKRYKDTFNLSSDAIVIATETGKIIDFNERVLEITEYSGKALEAITLQSILPEFGSKTSLQRYNQLLNGETIELFETVLLTKTDDSVPVEINVTLLNHYKTYDHVLCGSIRDISYRKKTEKDRQRFDLIINKVDDVFSVLDTQFVYELVNDAYCGIFNKQRDEIIGRSVSDLLGSDYYTINIKPHLERCLKGEEVQYSLWVDFPGKGRRFMKMNYYPMKAKDGTITGIISQGHDLTEEQRLTDKIVKSEKNWHKSFDALEDIMLIINKDFTIEKINKYGMKALQISESQAVGSKCYEIIQREKSCREFCPFHKSQKSSKKESTEYYNRQLEKYFSIKCTPVFDEKGNLVRFIDLIRDITDIKLTQKKLENVNTTKDKFLSILSHDLKNSFLSFSSGTGMLAEHFRDSDDEFVIKVSYELNKKAQFVNKLLNDLLNWSRIQQESLVFSPRHINLDVPVHFVINLFKSNAQAKNIDLECNIGNQAVFADAMMLETILRNLVSNAIKFTRPGGKININTKEAENFIQIDVVDNGVGIPKELEQRLFKLGENNISLEGTKGETGTGFGLIISQELVERNGGRIWAESIPGKGSTFSFTLPKQ